MLLTREGMPMLKLFVYIQTAVSAVLADDDRRDQRGQATAEYALVLLGVAAVALLLAAVQVGLIVRDQVLVVHAAREAAREAAVDPDPAAAKRAAVEGSGLRASRLRVTLTGAVTMRVEQ